MASQGNPVNTTVELNVSKAQAFQTVYAALAGQTGNYFDGTSVMMSGDSNLVVTRKFLPTWAIVVAVVGALLFLIGLLALLFRTTETCTISFMERDGKTVVTVAGTLSNEVYTSLNMALTGLQNA